MLEQVKEPSKPRVAIAGRALKADVVELVDTLS
jgi:hypothetical protein